MRQPMFLSRRFRHGAHQVKSRSSSGENFRPRSTRPWEMIFSKSCRSTGVVPI